MTPAPKKKKSTAAKLRSWRVWGPAPAPQPLGTVEAPDEKAAELPQPGSLT